MARSRSRIAFDGGQASFSAGYDGDGAFGMRAFMVAREETGRSGKA